MELTFLISVFISNPIFYFVGQHIKEFTDFLVKHPDTFKVIDDCVILADAENLQDVPLSERLHLPQPHIDTAATQQMLDFFVICLETKGEKYLDYMIAFCLFVSMYILPFDIFLITSYNLCFVKFCRTDYC